MSLEYSLTFFAETQDKVGTDLIVKIVESSRPVSGSADVFKHSYHLVGANLIFATNDGPLDAFVRDFVYVHKDDALFSAGNDDKCIIDTSVYTKNRQLRTPLSCKLDDSTKTPLTPLESWCGTDDIGDALVTNPAADLPIIGLEDFTTTMPPKTTKRAACCRAGGGGADQSQASERVSVRDEVVQSLQALLDAAGSTGCQVTPFACLSGMRGKQTFPCKNVQVRACLVSEGEEHIHNNAWLSVEQDGRVCYSCHAQSCKAKGPKHIGDMDPALLESGNSSWSSLSGKSAAATMQVDNGREELRDDGHLDDSTSACASTNVQLSSYATGHRSFVHSKVIRELALMGPVHTWEEARAVLSLASKAAGGQMQDHSLTSLVSAASEWLCRSFGAGSQDFADALESAGFARDLSVPGCTAALAQLKKTRHSMADWVTFREGTVPPSNGYAKDMTVDAFLKNVNPSPSTTHARSIVLAARLLWPDSQEKVHDFIKYSFKKSAACGLEREGEFDAAWSTESDLEETQEFRECILEKLLIMEQPFLRDILPRIMVPAIHGSSSSSGGSSDVSSSGIRVSSYQLSPELLTFWLDTEDYEKSTTEYRLSFCTGDITSPNGDGIIYNMYGMKVFFEQDGNTNLMANLIAERGIKNKLLFDEDDSEWRIFDETCGVWKHPLTQHEPEEIVSNFVQQELLPLKELEFFFGRELAWERKRAAYSETLEEGKAVDVSPEDSASQSGQSVGSKRSRNTVSSLSKKWKSQLSLALYRFGQTPREQAEILKMLQSKVIFSFKQVQKPHILCCLNGLVDLMTGELKGKPAADDFVTQMCYVEYDPNADTAGAFKVLDDYFPIEAYPDQEKMVAFLQQFLGYCLTLETNLQLCLFAYGNGSNGKSVLLALVENVFGKDLWSTLPIEALNKERGQNNDALNDARHARIVTLSESNGPPQVNEAVLRTLSCGEILTNKAMYKAEVSFKTYFKMFFVTNDLPKFTGDRKFCTSRRMAYLRFRTIFVDMNRPQDRNEADALRQAGAPDCLIKLKDPAYYLNHVAGKEKVFLKFFVDGAKEYYSNNKDIQIPESMKKAEEAEAFDVPAALDSFMDRLHPRSRSFQYVSDLYLEFTKSCVAEYGQDVGIKFESYNLHKFGADLSAAIDKKKASSHFWEQVKKKNVRSNGKNAKAWSNLEIRSVRQLLPENRFAAPNAPPFDLAFASAVVLQLPGNGGAAPNTSHP